MKNQRSEFKNVMAQSMRANLEAPPDKKKGAKKPTPKKAEKEPEDSYEECARCGAKLEGDEKEYGTCNECVKE